MGGSRWKTFSLRMGLRDTEGSAGAKIGLAGAMIVLVRFMGLMLSPSLRFPCLDSLSNILGQCVQHLGR